MAMSWDLAEGCDLCWGPNWSGNPPQGPDRIRVHRVFGGQSVVAGSYARQRVAGCVARTVSGA